MADSGSTLKPLRFVRIVDLTQNLPGPLATLLLADLGAEVIKVEPPSGDPLREVPPKVCGASILFHCLNRGKRFVCLDLKESRDRERFLKLVGTARCLVEGFRPGVLERLGLDPETLLASNPSLIVARLSGYGAKGPYRERAGHDLNFVALSGLLGRWPYLEPLPLQAADIGGAMLAAVTIVAALLGQALGEKQGKVLDIPLLDGALMFAMPYHAREAGGEDPSPGVGLLEGGLSTYRLYEDRDGGRVSVAALEPHFAEEVGRLVEKVGKVCGPRRLDKASIEAAFRSIPRKAFFGDNPLAPCCEPVLTLREAREHPAVKARGLFRAMKWEGGSILLPVTPYTSEVPDGPWAGDIGRDNALVSE